MRELQLTDAKARLSTVVDDALVGQPTVITRRGKKEVVVLAFADYERLALPAGRYTCRGAGG